MQGEPVAIVAVAARCALGASLAECVAALRAGECGVRVTGGLEQEPAAHAGIGSVPQDAASAESRAEHHLACTLHQLLAGDVLARLGASPGNVAVVLGTTLAGMRHCGAAFRAENADTSGGAHPARNTARADAAFARMPAGAVMRAALAGCGVEGPQVSVSSACASALSSVLHGCALVQSGAAQCVIAGGYDPISEFAYGGFAALQLVAAGPLSPFASDREGMKLGEGCALVLLCTLSHARACGVVPLGIIDGGGEASDAFHLTQPHPEGRGAARALQQATRGRLPGVLLAHGTGTPANDGAEYAAYRTAFGDALPSVPVSALKSCTGHPLGAAGALELVLGMACAAEGFLPAGAGRPVDRAAFPGLDLVQGACRVGTPGSVTALAAGFGGANAAVRVVVGGGCGDRDAAVTARGLAGAGDAAGAGGAPALRGGGGVRVVVRAMGAVSAGGRGVSGLWACGGGSAELEGVLAPLLDRARTRRLALLPRLLLAATRDLCEGAGLAGDALADTPLLAASWHGAAGFTEQYYRDLLASGIDLANPMLFAESVPNIGSAHVSLGFGMTAASATVIGTRTAALQALYLATNRMRAGHWSRALLVAGDETHPVVDRVLSRCTGTDTRTCAGAVALLLERATGAPGFPGDGACEVGAHLLAADAPHGDGGVGWATTASPCDSALLQNGLESCGVPELGCASGLAALAHALGAVRPGTARHIAIADPCGAAWCATATRHAHAAV